MVKLCVHFFCIHNQNKPDLLFSKCVVGSIAGVTNPANMILYSSTKSFINNFTTSLRVLAAPHGVDVVSVQPGFIDTRMTVALRSQESTVPDWTFAFPEGLADSVVRAVEKGGYGVVTWPFSQGLAAYALKGICNRYIVCGQN
jgi:short-subunit dehydrogenase